MTGDREVAQALSELSQRGWASFPGTLDEVSLFARRAGWCAVPLRRGDRPISDLQPVATDAARPNSISSRIGLGAQPLHTDGAHLAQPPHVVALASAGRQRAATRVWSAQGADVPWDALRHGVFRVSDGRTRQHCFAAEGQSIRFDACCMTPLDARSRSALRFFEATFDEADRHQWTSDEPEVLLIDNRRALHAREAVDPADPPRHLTRIAFRLPEAA